MKNQIVNGNFQNILQKKINWEMKPFPYAIIDDFFDVEIFKQVSKLSNLKKLEDLKKSFETDIEGKSVYGIKGLINTPLYFPVELMGFKTGKKLFNSLYKNLAKDLKTLGDFKNFGGYFPFHSSKNGGVLGSHVDHSSIGNYIHVANSIYFSHRKWDSKWGGQTILYDNNGIKPLVFIDPLPNRMILFIHSNISFHGVKKITCPEKITRNSYYMDYYLDNNQSEKFQKHLKLLGVSKNFAFSYHGTTFIPFLPNGLKSFSFYSLLKFSNYRYIKNYLWYLAFKNKFVNFIVFRIYKPFKNFFLKI